MKKINRKTANRIVTFASGFIWGWWLGTAMLTAITMIMDRIILSIVCLCILALALWGTELIKKTLKEKYYGELLK